MRKLTILFIFVIGCTQKEECYDKNTFYGLDNFSGRAGFPQYDSHEIVCTKKIPKDFELYVDFVPYEVDSLKGTVVLGKKVKRKLLTKYTKL